MGIFVLNINAFEQTVHVILRKNVDLHQSCKNLQDDHFSSFKTTHTHNNNRLMRPSVT